MKQILLIEDDTKICDSINNYFNSEQIKLHTIFDGKVALETINHLKPDLVLLDINLPNLSGVEILKEIKERDIRIPVIVITGYISTAVAIETMKEGAYEFVTKPFQLEKLARIVDKALQEKKGEGDSSGFGKIDRPEDENLIIGKSPEIVEIAKLIGQVAPTDAAVLIMGESGTGKELVARAIHRNSLRKDRPFLSVNCAALPESLLESELFGYEKGAFTGAYQKRFGKFEQADKGTIFLDEIADMSLMTQSKVLRVLQEQEFERVGGNQSIKVDVRIIAATNKSLVNCIKEGNFRVDLFYRLKVVSIYLPPLRERRSDIPLLADHFLKKYAELTGKKVSEVSDSAMKVLVKYPWPGNVRELENNIHTAVVMSKGGLLSPEHFPIFNDSKEKLEIDFEKIKKDYHKIMYAVLDPLFPKILANSDGHIYDHMEEALEKTIFDLSLKYFQGNQVKAAELLGVSRNTLRDRMKKYGIF
ncbi:MAG: sigma-54 dependent transcriptional regulator [candidate division Zixibacteria bacterium]|nr:sigma-54 dependent transcriptional regulator [candidate division Zixibacteria bacterium]